MLRSRYKLFSFLLFIMLSMFTNAANSSESANDIVVFVNKSISIDSLTMSELKQIFLKKKTRWTGGRPIVIINPYGSSPVRKRFSDKVLGMTATDVASYWEKERIRSQVEPPVEMGNTAKAVFHLRNAISYAYRKDVPDGVVKIVLVVPEKTSQETK